MYCPNSNLSNLNLYYRAPVDRFLLPNPSRSLNLRLWISIFASSASHSLIRSPSLAFDDELEGVLLLVLAARLPPPLTLPLAPILPALIAVPIRGEEENSE